MIDGGSGDGDDDTLTLDVVVVVATAVIALVAATASVRILQLLFFVFGGCTTMKVLPGVPEVVDSRVV